MSRVPVIASPCPLRWASAPQPGLDFCGQCQRRVHNLDFMSASERDTFFAGCAGEVCVSFTVRRPVRTSIAVGASLVAAAALAGSASAEPPADSLVDEEELIEVMVTGGTVTSDKLQWVDEAEAAFPVKPELPEISTVSWLPTPKG
jgi:hypothetical protein